MSGIVGIVGKSNVNQALYDGLTVLQHRGQDAAGIVPSHDGRVFLRKDNGLVRDVFQQRHMQRLVGHMGIGHVRYPTAGSSSSAEAQPFYVNSPYGITLAHNGNLTNVEQLTKEIYESDLRHVNTSSDSEVLLNVFAPDLAPGEAVYITTDGKLFTRQCADAPKLAPCIFEYVYLARSDSLMDGVSVYKARLRMGEKLADKILRERPDHGIDVVIPIPDTSRTAALELANRLGVKFREGFVKNRYIGRTFIMPGQAARKKSVRQKLNAIDLEFRGKNVMLVDDSIVRGTTCKQIIQMAREAGAKNVYFCSAAPAVRYPNVYGIDMPSAHELIAHNRSTQDVADLIGADWLIYQDLPDLIEAVGGGKIKIDKFDCAVFDGQYVTGDVDEAYLNKIEQARNDASKVKTQAVSAIIDLYNN